jgi:L-fuconolactonase
MQYVDTHPHVLATDTQKYPVAPLGGVQSEWSRDFQNTGEDFLRRMDEAGVQQATLVQASTFHGTDNSYLAEVVAAHPDRFVGVTCVDPLAEGAPDTLSFWIEQRKLHGVRLFTAGSTMQNASADWLIDPKLDAFWDRARDLNIPINMQLRYPSLHLLRTIMERHPRTRFILDHLAGPQLEDGPPYAAAQDLLALGSYPQVSLKFSKHNLDNAARGASTVEAFMRALIGAFGADRLMWGSNFPATRLQSATPYKDILLEARQTLAFLSVEEQGWVFGRAAMRAYPALEQVSSATAN